MQFRPIDLPEDAEAVSRIMAQFDPEPLEPSAVVSRWQTDDQAVNPLRLAVEEDNNVVAYMNARRWKFMEEGLAMVDIGVDESHRRQSIGSQLFRLAQQHAKSKGWTTFFTKGREQDDLGAEQFWLSQGFQERFRLFESVLDLDSIKSDFSQLYEQKLQEGYEFVSARSLNLEDDAIRRKLHEFHNEMDQDEPGNADFGLMDFEAFNVEFQEVLNKNGDQIIAVKNGIWAGTHVFAPNDKGDTDANTGYTGVVREFRGQGLAKTLKWAGVKEYQKRGWKTVLTHNDTRNIPMWKINEQLGFKRRPGWIFFKKTL